jgi:hypothetical protein
MKKIYIAMAVLATAVLSSCEREKDFNGLTPVGENGIAFVLNGVSTRSAEMQPAAVKGDVIPLGETGGESFFLSETIEELNPTPATKGAPAYTFNVGTLYKTMGVYAAGNFGDATFGRMDEGMYDSPVGEGEKGWRYQHNYATYPWPANKDEDVDFYLRMPADISGISDLNYENNISFSFVSPTTAATQKDILFGHTSISYNDHKGYLPKGAPVMMYHALTGIKFRVGNDNSGTTKTVITRVEISNIYDKGNCVINPATGAVSWPADELGMQLGSCSQDFDNPAYSTGKDGTVDYGSDSKYAGTSFISKNTTDKRTEDINMQNLNDEDGSLTFWLIPQVLSDDVTMKVYFRVKTPDTPDGTEISHTIALGTRSNNVEWKAGQLRTYTLEPRDVDVEIFDTMSGLSKTNLHVTNTGNVPEYIRMLVIGNWYGWETENDMNTGKEAKILVGYKYAGNESADQIDEGDTIDTMMDPWYRETPKYGQYFDGSFTNGKPTGENKWLRGNTGFYYPFVIGPGQTLNSQTEALFKSYIWPEDVPIPTIYIPDPNSNVRKPAVGVHLIMEVAVQAIGSKKPDGTDYADCWEAWTAAIYPNGDGTIGPK